MSKEELEGVALAFPDSGSAGNTNTGNCARRTLSKEHLRERSSRLFQSSTEIVSGNTVLSMDNIDIGYHYNVTNVDII